MDGYYLIDSLGTVNRSNLIFYSKQLYNLDIIADYPASMLSRVDEFAEHDTIILSRGNGFLVPKNGNFGSDVYLYIDNSVIRFCNSSENTILFSQYHLPFSTYNANSSSSLGLMYGSTQTNFVGTLGSPIKIFYSLGDLRKFWYYGQQHYSASLPKGLYRIPINVVKNYNTTNTPNITYNNNVTNMDAPDIENSLNITLKGYLDKLFSGEFNSVNPTPGGGSSGGSSGGDHGGSGGDFGNPTPTPDPDSGFTSGTYDLLDQIYKWLVSFGEKHDIFAKKITDYIEANDGKLDQIIEAINALGNGKTETENNGCKYDFSALSDFMSKLWNESDKKFDNMVSLLEENNKYQQKLVNSLNEIKAILVTQTVLELFQDRSSETANKAKDKFPTSLPWDIAMVVNAMAAEPQEIKIDLPIEIQSLGIHEEINIDLSSGEWEKLAKTCRYLLSILFILFMIHLSRKMFFNGGDD